MTEKTELKNLKGEALRRSLQKIVQTLDNAHEIKVARGDLRNKLSYEKNSLKLLNYKVNTIDNDIEKLRHEDIDELAALRAAEEELRQSENEEHKFPPLIFLGVYTVVLAIICLILAFWPGMFPDSSMAFSYILVPYLIAIVLAYIFFDKGHKILAALALLISFFKVFSSAGSNLLAFAIILVVNMAISSIITFALTLIRKNNVKKLAASKRDELLEKHIARLKREKKKTISAMKKEKDKLPEDISKIEKAIPETEKQLANAEKALEKAEKEVAAVQKILGANLHSDYHKSDVLRVFIELVERGRADTLKECINVYEQEKKNLEIEMKVAKVRADSESARDLAYEAKNEQEKISSEMNAQFSSIESKINQVGTEVNKVKAMAEQISTEVERVDIEQKATRATARERIFSEQEKKRYDRQYRDNKNK